MFLHKNGMASMFPQIPIKNPLMHKKHAHLFTWVN